MEADFNATNKVIHRIHMLHNMQKYRFMPDEVYSERNRLADDGTLSKILACDILQQLWHPVDLASVNANNCYDQIAHPMASMVFQLFVRAYPSHQIQSHNNLGYEVLPQDGIWRFYWLCRWE